jgi:outer membrane murein-binding lipoprotein Lpp
VNELSAEVQSIQGQKRKLEGDIQAMQSDLDEMNSEVKAADALQNTCRTNSIHIHIQN